MNLLKVVQLRSSFQPTADAVILADKGMALRKTSPGMEGKKSLLMSAENSLGSLSCQLSVIAYRPSCHGRASFSCFLFSHSR